MKIAGVGIVKKEEVMSILSQDGREALENGEISLDELGEMYKLELVKRNSKIGKSAELFSTNYNRIPEGLQEKLSPEELGELVDAFYACYKDGEA